MRSAFLPPEGPCVRNELESEFDGVRICGRVS